MDQNVTPIVRNFISWTTLLLNICWLMDPTIVLDYFFNLFPFNQLCRPIQLRSVDLFWRIEWLVRVLSCPYSNRFYLWRSSLLLNSTWLSQPIQIRPDFGTFTFWSLVDWYDSAPSNQSITPIVRNFISWTTLLLNICWLMDPTIVCLGLFFQLVSV
jgi:hypothetical protein